MARYYEDNCVGCDECMGNCNNKCKSLVCTCDKCGDGFDAEELYVTEDGDMCQECILNEFDTVAQELERDGYDE